MSRMIHNRYRCQLMALVAVAVTLNVAGLGSTGKDLSIQSLQDSGEFGHKQQTFTNDLGEQQRLFTTSGQQLLRPEMFADTADQGFYQQFVHSGISRDLNDGLAKELKDIGAGIKDGAIDLYEAAKQNPAGTAKAVLEASWEAITGLPGAMWDGMHESGNALGEGAAVALSADLMEQLNALYGSDVEGMQKAIFSIRTASSIVSAVGAGKLAQQTGELSAEVGKAAGKKLDGALEEKALEAFLRSGGRFDVDGTPLLDLKVLSRDQKRMMGELLGEETAVKQIIPDGEKLARMQGTGTNGIDDLYKVNRDDVDYVVIEYKFVGNPKDKGSWKLDKTEDGKQGSESWITGSNRLEKAVGELQAPDVKRAIESGRFESWVVTTRPDGSTLLEVLDAFGNTKPIDTSKILSGINLSGAKL